LKLTPEIQAMVIDAKPEAFAPAAGAWGRSGWTHVHLQHVEVGALRDLLLEAFRLVAPKRVLAALSGTAGPKASKPRGRR
ncbi:MAG TPA: MmcQ/YjbR family DNA-binding protein, partial [Polyangiales bacterium]|nr:MmcQ/YjbR family DNA-binding protein [Polyangiales bacterium]